MSTVVILTKDYYESTTVGIFTKEAWNRQLEIFQNEAEKLIQDRIKTINEGLEHLRVGLKENGQIIHEIQVELEKFSGEMKHSSEYKEAKKKYNNFVKEYKNGTLNQIHACENKIKELESMSNERKIEFYMDMYEYMYEEVEVFEDGVSVDKLAPNILD